MDEVASIRPGGSAEPGDALAEAREAAAQVAAWQARLVEATRQAMETPLGEPWRPYLAWQLGLTTSESAELIELVDRLTELPLTEELLATGERSLRSVLAIARRCTPDTEATVIEAAHELSGAQLERILREYARVVAPSRRVDPDDIDDEADDEPRPSSAGWGWNDGRFRLHADLDAADGAMLAGWLDAERARVASEGAVGEPTETSSWERSCAEALLALGERAAGARSGSGVFLSETAAVNVVVHAHEDPDGLVIDRSFIPGVGPIPNWWTTMLAEQGTLTYTVMLGGEPVLATVPARFATPAQRQAMLARDGGCAYPSCGIARRLIAHHIRYYDDGGPTELRNMVLLCRRHHRLVHANRLRIEPDATAPEGRHRWRFLYPDGSPLIPNSPTHGARTPTRHLAVRQRRRGSGEALTRYARDVIIAQLLTAA